MEGTAQVWLPVYILQPLTQPPDPTLPPTTHPSELNECRSSTPLSTPRFTTLWPTPYAGLTCTHYQCHPPDGVANSDKKRYSYDMLHIFHIFCHTYRLATYVGGGVSQDFRPRSKKVQIRPNFRPGFGLQSNPKPFFFDCTKKNGFPKYIPCWRFQPASLPPEFQGEQACRCLI